MNAPRTKPTTQPDYPGLVRLLPYLRHLVDSQGMVILALEGAERVRNLGFQATPGPWHVPPIPAALVAGNPLLEPLGDDVDRFWHPRPAEPEPSCQAAEIAGLNHVEHRDVATGISVTLAEPSEILNPTAKRESAAILAAINRAGGSVERRKLQKKFWRMGATAYNAAIQQLVREGLITVDGNLFHTFLEANDGVPQPGSAGGIVERDPSGMPLAIFEKEQ